MNVLTIGTDETIFDKNSLLRQRVLDYSANFTSFHVFCKSGAPRLGRVAFMRYEVSSTPARGAESRTEGHKPTANTSGPLVRDGTRHSTEILGKVVIHPLPKFWPLFLLTGYRSGSFLLRSGGRWVVSSENTSMEGILAFLLSRRWGRPLQFQIHTDIFGSWYRYAGWKERIRFWLAKFLVPRADCIRVVSERIKRSIIFNFQFSISNQFSNSKRVTVLPIYTDIHKFLDARPDPVIEERFKNYDFKMIAVGRFVDREKNFSMLIEVMRDFVKICPKALLVLVGEGPDGENYKLQITNYKLDRNVIIDGWRNDLPQFYKFFDLYLMSSNYEGWGRTAIEAMAAGVPVVMTDVGLAGEVVKNRENGVVVPVSDKMSMLQAVTDLYRNPELRAKFSEAGLETVENLEPKSNEGYLKLYAASYCHTKGR